VHRFRALDVYAVGICVIVAIGVALRAYHLGEQSLWIDELGEGTTAQGSLSQVFNGVRADFGAAPLDYLGVKLFTSVLGHGTIATRSWAFVMGCAAIPVIYLLGTRLYRDRMVGLIAATMLALSAFHIYYSQEARFYALPVVVGMLSLYAFLRALDSGAVKDWLVYAAVTVVALYSHYFLAILLPIEGLYLVGVQLALSLRNGTEHPIKAGLAQVGMCLAAQVAAVLALSPWLAFAFRSQVGAGYPVLPPLGLARIHQIFVVLIGLAPLNSLPPAPLGPTVRTDLVLALAVLGLIWALALRRMRVVLLAGLLVSVIPLAWLSDQWARYFWSERQVIFVLVPLYLLAAIGARHLLGTGGQLAGAAARRAWFGLSEVGWQQRRAALAAALAVVLAVGWGTAYSSPIRLVYQDRWLTKADWRAVAAYIDSQGCPDSRYWSFLGDHYSYGFAYYDPGLFPRSRFLYLLPDGSYNTSVVDDIQRQSIGSRDWLILDTATIALPSDGDTPIGLLQRQGWSYTPFTGLLVYHRQTCGGSAAEAASEDVG
jgi:hypothetical protein